jgi:RNA-directed DNA polymerase
MRKRYGTKSVVYSLSLSVEKTKICHINEGFEFLGWRIQRQPRPSRAGKWAIYTYPSKKALAAIKDKVRSLTRGAMHRTFADLLRRLNPVLRGWCNYFRHGVCKRTFGYIDSFVFRRILNWLRKRHDGLNMCQLVRRHLPGWEIRSEGVELFRLQAIKIERYRYRGNQIPTPWANKAAAGRSAPKA